MGMQNSQRDAMNAVFPPEYIAAIQNAMGGAERAANQSEFRRVVEVDIKIHTPTGTETVQFKVCPATSALDRQPNMGTAACIDQAHDMISERFATLMANLVGVGYAAGESNTVQYMMMRHPGFSEGMPPAGQANGN